MTNDSLVRNPGPSLEYFRISPGQLLKLFALLLGGAAHAAATPRVFPKIPTMLKPERSLNRGLCRNRLLRDLGLEEP